MARVVHNVFVYGTLRRGESNHHWLRGARFLQHWTTPAWFTLYDIGPCPVLCDQGNQRVRGEIYRVSSRGMALLDRLEDYPAHYDRRLITTPCGQAWIYFQHRAPSSGRGIPSGDWVHRRRP